MQLSRCTKFKSKLSATIAWSVIAPPIRSWSVIARTVIGMMISVVVSDRVTQNPRRRHSCDCDRRINGVANGLPLRTWLLWH